MSKILTVALHCDSVEDGVNNERDATPKGDKYQLMRNIQPETTGKVTSHKLKIDSRKKRDMVG